jgi:hypothetical protein
MVLGRSTGPNLRRAASVYLAAYLGPNIAGSLPAYLAQDEPSDSLIFSQSSADGWVRRGSTMADLAFSSPSKE